MSTLATGIGVSALGYLSGVLGAVIVLTLLISLTVVKRVLMSVGGSPESHIGAIVESLTAVSKSTDPIPPVLTAINGGLTELAGVFAAVGGHLATARFVFDSVAEGN